MAYAASEIYVLETVKIEARQLVGGVGQDDFSPLIKPAAREVLYLGTARPTWHAEVVREVNSGDGEVTLFAADGSDNHDIHYLYLKHDRGAAALYLVLKFTSSLLSVVTLNVGGGILIDLTDCSTDSIDAATITVQVGGSGSVNLRCYVAGI